MYDLNVIWPIKSVMCGNRWTVCMHPQYQTGSVKASLSVALLVTKDKNEKQKRNAVIFGEIGLLAFVPGVR